MSTYAERVQPCGCRGVPDGQHLPDCDRPDEDLIQDAENRSDAGLGEHRVYRTGGQNTGKLNGLIMDYEKRIRELEEQKAAISRARQAREDARDERIRELEAENARLAINLAEAESRRQRIETFIGRLKHALQVLDLDLMEDEEEAGPPDGAPVPAKRIDSLADLPPEALRGTDGSISIGVKQAATLVADQDNYEQ
jgi:predicted RNase H-like nuclease (RuvC/YqgF family)